MFAQIQQNVTPFFLMWRRLFQQEGGKENKKHDISASFLCEESKLRILFLWEKNTSAVLLFHNKKQSVSMKNLFSWLKGTILFCFGVRLEFFFTNEQSGQIRKKSKNVCQKGNNFTKFMSTRWLCFLRSNAFADSKIQRAWRNLQLNSNMANNQTQTWKQSPQGMMKFLSWTQSFVRCISFVLHFKFKSSPYHLVVLPTKSRSFCSRSNEQVQWNQKTHNRNSNFSVLLNFVFRLSR